MPIDLTEKRLSAVIATTSNAVDAEESLAELEQLLRNLDVTVLLKSLQRRRYPDPATFIGRGKALELRDAAHGVGAGLLVIDEPLTPTQRSNLRKATGLEVWDRAYTIMKIFERRASTSEAKLQVELARLRYEIPSLKGLGHQMSRLGGGIGTRGPGETEFERHRRKLERRVKAIEKSLRNVRARRNQYRTRRRKEGVRVVSLVGYTNSGKSTLLRALSHDQSVVAEDRLFSTLDTLSRMIRNASGAGFMLSDTVGFIRNLPPELVAAFRATLEEVSGADLLLLVLDASSPDPSATLAVVEETLRTIGADEIPRIIALNKIDTCGEESVFIAAGLASSGNEVVRVSALRRTGLDELVSRIINRLGEANSYR